MHSRIFQIATERIDKDCYLNEDTLTQGDDGYYDYCSEIDDDTRKEDIANLVEYALPKGMFTLITEDTICYNGGLEQWKEAFVADIRTQAEAITVDNVMDWGGSVYQLEKALKNPLNTAYHFYLDGDGCQSFAEQSYAFMDFVASLEVGTILYIGGVIDYHF